MGIILTTGFLLICCEPQEPAQLSAPPSAKSGVIVAVGNSLTEGYGVPEEEAYPARLERRLQQSGYRYTVVNAGISGETSSGARSRLDWIMTLRPDIVILETGANDGLRGIDPELIRENIDFMVKELTTRKVVVVLAGMKMMANLGPKYTAAFASIYPDIAARYNAVLMPFFLEEVAAVPGLNQTDGIHPSAQGYQIITDNIYPYVIEAIRKHEAATAGPESPK